MWVRRGYDTQSGVLACLFLVSILFAGASASANGFGLGIATDDSMGLSLRELIDDAGAFTSRTGDLRFSEFQADTHGVAPGDLDLYRIFPTNDGFKIVTPLVAEGGAEGGLSLSYAVRAADDLLIEAVGVSFRGTALLGRSETSAGYASDTGRPLADLIVWAGKAVRTDRPHGTTDLDGDDGSHKARRSDDARLLEAVRSLTVTETMRIETGILAENLYTTHDFGTRPIPEPTTALMLGLGLAGLGYAGRRRRS